MFRRYILKVKDGKFVTIRRFSEGLKLCAIEHHTEGNNVPFVFMKTDHNLIALRFQHDNVDYFPTVDGNRLTLKRVGDHNAGSGWFEKENLGLGEHYGLRTVVEPRQYLSIGDERGDLFMLIETPQGCAQVTHEEIK